MACNVLQGHIPGGIRNNLVTLHGATRRSSANSPDSPPNHKTSGPAQYIHDNRRLHRLHRLPGGAPLVLRAFRLPGVRTPPLGLRGIRDRVHHVPDKALERLVLHELLVHLRVLLQQELHDLGQRLIVGETRGVRGVLPNIPEGTGSTSASWSASAMAIAAFFSTRLKSSPGPSALSRTGSSAYWSHGPTLGRRAHCRSREDRHCRQ